MDESESRGAPRAQDSAGQRAEFSALFVRLLPVSGSAVSTVGDLLGSETISASDAQAARLDELQFDLGEGPCWDALRYRRPILEPDLQTRPRRWWPMFSPAVSQEDVGALFAFPMLVGSLKIGAVDIYSREPMSLTDRQTEQAVELTQRVARSVLQSALLPLDEEEQRDTVAPKYSRRLVHQATGMVLAQLGVTAEDAHLVIRAHAFSTNRTMMAVSRDILEGRLDFSEPENAGEGRDGCDP
ncbi:GAF and ANTAR domain-containing protein [Leifsonia sp. fls2-241-R2A-40a]|uniref:GAF and ANTAR domain-containing protein n=1 Tax=Leifsonia sp. fls2-241-R2A-40a TaxID=3040290 RepID=UPI00254A7463|nr:GAF and ANTAR domain-containing protein [Leifsonia sp. fls2-241-R2A-40a]